MREVDSKGTVARLTNFNVPSAPVDENDEPEKNKFVLSEEDKASMEKVVKGEGKLLKNFNFKMNEVFENEKSARRSSYVKRARK